MMDVCEDLISLISDYHKKALKLLTLSLNIAISSSVSVSALAMTGIRLTLV